MRLPGNIFAGYDADGQHRVENLITVARRLMEDDLDYCVGVRDSSSYQVPSRRLGKWILQLTVRLAARQPVQDFNSGLRGFKRKVLLRYAHLLPPGFGASTTTTLLMLERNYHGGQVPITVHPRVGSSSVRQFRDGTRTLILILRTFLLFKPLHFFGGIGVVSMLIGIIYGLITAFTEKLGFPVLSAVMILFGAQSIFFGLVVDQISAMRRERFE